MSDDLIKRLRLELIKRPQLQSEHIEQLERDLAKAVNALQEIVAEFDCPIARAALAELEGK